MPAKFFATISIVSQSRNDRYLRIPAVHRVSSHRGALSRSRPQSTSDGLTWGPAHGPQTVEDGGLGADEATGPSRRWTGHRGPSSGSVEHMVWQAAAVMAMRIMR
jgi:hypothetical protein